MCLTCYRAMGSPQVDNPHVRRMTAAAADLRSSRVDDLIREWDIEDVHLEGFLAWPNIPEREWAWTKSFKNLSLAERASVLALIAGFWRP